MATPPNTLRGLPAACTPSAPLLVPQLPGQPCSFQLICLCLKKAKVHFCLGNSRKLLKPLTHHKQCRQDKKFHPCIYLGENGHVS